MGCCCSKNPDKDDLLQKMPSKFTIDRRHSSYDVDTARLLEDPSSLKTSLGGNGISHSASGRLGRTNYATIKHAKTRGAGEGRKVKPPTVPNSVSKTSSKVSQKAPPIPPPRRKILKNSKTPKSSNELSGLDRRMSSSTKPDTNRSGDNGRFSLERSSRMLKYSESVRKRRKEYKERLEKSQESLWSEATTFYSTGDEKEDVDVIKINVEEEYYSSNDAKNRLSTFR